MIDRVHSLGQIHQDPFYFQLIPLKLKKIESRNKQAIEGTTYKFNISKGKQKFDQNRDTIQPNFLLLNGECFMAIKSCKLNFFLPTFNPLRKQQFILRMLECVMDEEFEVGSYIINVGQLIEAHKRQNKSKQQFNISLSKDYELQFEVFIDRTKIGVEKSVRQSRTEPSSQVSTINHFESVEIKLQQVSNTIAIIPEQDKDMPSVVKQSNIRASQQKNEQQDQLHNRDQKHNVCQLDSNKKSSPNSQISRKKSITDKVTQSPFPKRRPSNKQILLLCIFLLLGALVVLLLVHPSKKI